MPPKSKTVVADQQAAAIQALEPESLREEAGSTAGQDAHSDLAESQAPDGASGLELPAESAQASAAGGHSVDGPEVTALDDAIPALWIRSVPSTFRRCGFAFTREGIGIAMDALDEDQIERLVNEPNLVVEHTWFTDRAQG